MELVAALDFWLEAQLDPWLDSMSDSWLDEVMVCEWWELRLDLGFVLGRRMAEQQERSLALTEN